MLSKRNLHHLLVLLNYGHFGRAAKALKISQPALTKSIQALEADLGAPLLDRKRGALALTVFGELVVERSKSLLTAEAELRREIKLLAGHEIGSLRMALGPYPSVTSGYAAIARLASSNPKLGISVTVAGWRTVANLVSARSVDIGMAEIGGLIENQQFETELVAQPQARFFCRPGHPLSARKSASLSALLAFPWVTTRIPARFARGMPPDLGAAGKIDPANGDFVPAVEIDVPMQLPRFLAGSDALVLGSLTMLERELRAGEVSVLQTTGVGLKAGYGFIYLRNRSLAPATLAYMQEVREVELELARKEIELEAAYLISRKKASPPSRGPASVPPAGD